MPARDPWYRTWQTSARSDPGVGSSSSIKTLHQDIVLFGDTVLRFNFVPTCYLCVVSSLSQNAANAIKFDRGGTDARSFHLRQM